jgi:Fe-S cluster assembly ATP-binding protein
MLKIENLKVSVQDKVILNNLDLEVKAGEVHAIMGPNGSGKSTLAHVLAGREGYKIEGGSISYRGQDLLPLSVEERAHQGIFLGMQYPVELPGVNNLTFLREAVNSQRRGNGNPELSASEFMKLVRARAELVELPDRLLKRDINSGFSGGEKKRNEILQMALFEPMLAILDETDSGLDIDALRVIASGVNKMRDTVHAMIVITHYQRLLEYIVPDRVHVLIDGRIVKSGDQELAEELEEKGYAWLQEAHAA